MVAAIINGPSVPGIVSKDHATQEYQVTLDKPGNLIVYLDGLSGNADVVLLDKDKVGISLLGQQLLTSNNPELLPEIVSFNDFAIALHPSVQTELKAGTYYVQVALGEGSERAEFTLHVKDDKAPTVIDLGSLPAGPFNYRGSTDDKVEYNFTVEKETVYTLMAGSADQTLDPEIYIKAADGKKVKAERMPEVPYKVFQFKEHKFSPGKYTLVLKSPKGQMQYGVSGISKDKQDELEAQNAALRKQFEEQMAKAKAAESHNK